MSRTGNTTGAGNRRNDGPRRISSGVDPQETVLQTGVTLSGRPAIVSSSDALILM